MFTGSGITYSSVIIYITLDKRMCYLYYSYILFAKILFLRA